MDNVDDGIAIFVMDEDSLYVYNEDEWFMMSSSVPTNKSTLI